MVPFGSLFRQALITAICSNIYLFEPYGGIEPPLTPSKAKCSA